MFTERQWPPRKRSDEDEWAWKERLDTEVAAMLGELDRRLTAGDPDVIAMVQQAELDEAQVSFYEQLAFGADPMSNDNDSFDASTLARIEAALFTNPDLLNPHSEGIILRSHELDFAILDGDPEAVRSHVETEIITWTVNQLRREDI